MVLRYDFERKLWMTRKFGMIWSEWGECISLERFSAFPSIFVAWHGFWVAWLRVGNDSAISFAFVGVAGAKFRCTDSILQYGSKER